MKCKDCEFYTVKNSFIGVCKAHGGLYKPDTEQCSSFQQTVMATRTIIRNGKKIIENL